MAGHRAGEVAADQDILLALRLALVDHIGSAGDVDDRVRQGLVERDGGIAEAGDARLVTQCLTQRLAEDDRGVLDRVVDVDVDVAGRLDAEVDEGVLGQGGQHVVVERDAGRGVGLPRPVEVESQLDRRLLGRPGDRGGPAAWCHASSSAVSKGRGSTVLGVASGPTWVGASSAIAARNRVVSSGVPAVTRRW